MKIKKIVLVQPNLRWIDGNFKTLWDIHPINLLLIAAMIETRCEVVILDANIHRLSPDDFRAQLAALNPDLIGITLLTMEYAETAHIAARLSKEACPAVPTVLGGIYASQAPLVAGKDTNIDYLVLGEGEYTFPRLLDYLEGHGDFPQAGIAYWKNGERIIQNRPPFIQDLDQLPIPAYHLVDYHLYANTIQRISVDSPRELPYGRMFTSRGCPVGCTFCEIESISGKPFRGRSVSHIMKEMKYLKDHYHIKSVIFDDDNLYIDRKRSLELFQTMVDEKIDLRWNAIAVPVFSLYDELLEVMKASGCQYLDMAIESGVERVLYDIVHKPVRLSHVRKIVAKAKELDIDTNCHFIIGFPGETWDEIRQTIKFAEELDADYTKFFIYQPLPDTPLYKKVVEEGWLRGGVDVQTGLNWSDSAIVSDEFTAQDLRVLRAYEWERINFSNPAKREKIRRMMRISEEDLTRLRKDTLSSTALATYPALPKEPTPLLEVAGRQFLGSL